MHLSAICFGGLSIPAGPSGDVPSLNIDSDSVEPSDKTAKCVAPKNYIEQLKDLATFVQKCFTLYFFSFSPFHHCNCNAVRFQPAIQQPGLQPICTFTSPPGEKRVSASVLRTVLEQGTSVVGTT